MINLMMDTMDTEKKRRRRNHSPALKAQILAECVAPGASVAKVAMAHGINANIVHGWRKAAREQAAQPVAAPPAFVPLAIEAVPPGAAHRSASAPRGSDDDDRLAGVVQRRDDGLDARAAAVIRLDAMWLAVEPVDMRAGAERLLARVVQVFGRAQAHHGYVFANVRGTRLKLVVRDGFGVWCATRRLNQGRFVWPVLNTQVPALTREQFDALVVCLPWQRLQQLQTITRM